MDRKGEIGWFTQVVDALTENCKKSWDLLLSEVLGEVKHRKSADGNRSEFETKGYDEIEDHTANMQCSKLYSSQIHQQIPNGLANQSQVKSSTPKNQIEEIIEIFQSRVEQSPGKTNRVNNKSKARQELSPKSKQEKLLYIQRQKLKVQQQLRRLNEEAKLIKKEETENKSSHKSKDHAKDVEAAEQAQKMLLRVQKERKQLQQRKNKEQLKYLEQLQKENAEKEARRRDETEKMKQQKREAILRKMQEKKRAREEKMMINKESDMLIQELKKSESFSKEQPASNLDEKKQTLQMKRNFSQKRETANSKSIFAEDPKQSRQFRAKVRSKEANTRQNNEELPKPLVHYPKGKFLQVLEEEERRKKQQQKMKQEGKRKALEKRMKYGEIIKNLFIPPPAPKERNNSYVGQPRMKPPTPDEPTNPKLKTSLPRRTQDQVYSKASKSKDHNYKNKQPSERQSYASDNIYEKKEQEREMRLKELRKETLLRMKKVEEKQQELLISHHNAPQTKKYSNYLKQLPKPKASQNSWKKILQNENLSKQQKVSELISKANLLQSKARLKEQLHKPDEETMDLILGSIQAKLALLDEL